MLNGINIRKSYGANHVLLGIDVQILPGQITAVIGPSGSGKSTLVRALSLLEPPDEGVISIDGADYVYPVHRGGTIPSPWPNVSVVFQQLFLWPHLTLMRNITLPLEETQRGVSSGELAELLDIFELSELVHRYPNEVSIGQRQRAALVRTLALKPRYLLLDEITSALDVEHVSRLLAYLQILKARGVGILLITHLIGFARSAADQIIFVENGRVLDSGGAELLVSPSNERLAKFLSLVHSAM